MPPRGAETSTSFGFYAAADGRNEPTSLIPSWIPDDVNDLIPRISCCTLLDIIHGKYDDTFEHRILVDCRFGYEYEGGHINGAVRHADKYALATQLLRHSISKRILLVLYCEFSKYRSPLMASHIRSEDRKFNMENWPRLSLPNTYILDGGYDRFYATNPDECIPKGYTEMKDINYKDICERELNQLRLQRTRKRAKNRTAHGAAEARK